MKLKITQSALDRITAPAKGRLTVHDTATPGLACQITSNNARTFYTVRWQNGRVLWVRLGAVGEMTVDEAKRKAREKNSDIADDVNPNAHKRAARDAATLGDLWQHYQTVQRVKDRTARDYAKNYERYLSPWASKRLAEITRDDVKRLHTRIAEEKMDRDSPTGGRRIKGGPTAANRTLALLSILFNAGVDEFKIGINPARGVKRVKESARERFLNADELPAFMRAVDDLDGDLAKDFIRLALYTGQRRANLQAMAWADVSLPFATWTVAREEMKGDRAHVVPLVKQAVEILERRRKADPKGEWVFPTASASGHIEEPKKALSMVCKAAGIEAVSPHDLRRSCATWCNATGASEGTIAALLAHKRQSVTGAVYIKVQLDTVRTALQRAVDSMMSVQPQAAKKGAA